VSITSSFRQGETVALRPRKGYTTPTYAKVVERSASTVRVIVTADSGGRKRGEPVTLPQGHLSPRLRGQHRKSAPRRPWHRGWWGR